MNIEFEARWPKASEIEERAYERLASGAWTFWLFDKRVPPGLEDAPFVTTIEFLHKLLAEPVPYLAWTPDAMTVRCNYASRRSNSICLTCGFPRLDPEFGDHCWRCCFGRDLVKRWRSVNANFRTWDRVPYSTIDVIDFHNVVEALPRELRGVFAAQYSWREERFARIAAARRELADSYKDM